MHRFWMLSSADLFRETLIISRNKRELSVLRSMAVCVEISRDVVKTKRYASGRPDAIFTVFPRYSVIDSKVLVGTKYFLDDLRRK